MASASSHAIFDNDQSIDTEICALEARLEVLKTARQTPTAHDAELPSDAQGGDDSSLHSLLLLSDSALPLGSFAFSAGLESFLMHTPKHPAARGLDRFKHFLSLSVHSIAAMTLSYVHRAWTTPQDLLKLDDHIEASTTCAVNRRASVAQGRALVTMWQRSFQKQIHAGSPRQIVAEQALSQLSNTLVREDTSNSSPGMSESWPQMPQAHFAPLFGVLAAVMQITLRQTLYLYLLNHIKMILSAAIRASVLGPYQSQSLLASNAVKAQITQLANRQVLVSSKPEDAGQNVPAMDIWSGRHELIYSRIFNS